MQRRSPRAMAITIQTIKSGCSPQFAKLHSAKCFGESNSRLRTSSSISSVPDAALKQVSQTPLPTSAIRTNGVIREIWEEALSFEHVNSFPPACCSERSSLGAGLSKNLIGKCADDPDIFGEIGRDVVANLQVGRIIEAEPNGACGVFPNEDLEWQINRDGRRSQHQGCAGDGIAEDQELG